MGRELTTVAVVGLGTMGAGVAEVPARAGIEVIGVEKDAAGLTRGRGHLAHSTDRAVERGKLSAEERDALLGRIRTGTDLAAVADVALVIEAIDEDEEAK